VSEKDDESWLIFGLILNFISADIGMTKVELGDKPPFPVKFIRAMMLLAHESESITVSRLAEGLGVSMPRASRIADDLVREGMLIRDRSEQDRRELQLTLTPKARKFTSLIWQQRRSAIHRTLNQFDAGELLAVKKFFTALTDSYREEFKG
jgi:DNA-binding MarR family transcriptional regulator